MGVVTRTGDDGQTSLFDSSRVFKSDPRVVTYGKIDSLNSHLGLLIACFQTSNAMFVEKEFRDLLVRMVELMGSRVQPSLFCLGAWLATPNGIGRKALPEVESVLATDLESLIVQAEAILPRMTHFILPGGGVFASQAHVARTVCREAECALVALCQELGQTHEEVAPRGLALLNRLSDFLFILARVGAAASRQAEYKWIPQKPAVS